MHLQLLAYTFGAFSLDLLPSLHPIPVDSRIDCLSRCYHQTNCSSFFYLDGSCYLTEHVYAVAKQSIPSNEMQYFVLVSDKCRYDYIWYRTLGLCYRLSLQAKLWQDAENQCQSEGGHLITVDSPRLHDFMIHLVTSLDRSFWIGGKTFTGTEWVWADGSTVDTDFWEPGEPAGGPNRCILVHKYSKQWRDESCIYTVRFVCVVHLSAMYIC